MSSGDELGWYSVRCVFAMGQGSARGTGLYEERITLWRAASFDDAIAKAESEAREYVEDSADSAYLGLAQAYRLADEPGDGAEVFSLMRDSALGPEEYLDGLFDTGFERQRQLE